MNRFDRWLEAFVPATLREDHSTHRRARTAVLFAVSGWLWGPLWALLYVFVLYMPIAATCQAFLGVSTALTPWLLRRTGSLTLVASLLCSILLVAAASTSASRGGFPAEVLVWSIATPFLAVSLGERRVAMVFSGLVLLTFVAFFALDVAGLTLPPPEEASTAALRLLDMVGLVGLLALIGVLATVTELERAREAEERKATQDQLREVRHIESLGRLAGGIAHDYNNILTSVLSHSQLARHSLPEGHDALEDLAAIEAAGRRAASLTSQLLVFGRKQVNHPEVVELNQVVDDTVQLLRRTLGPKVTLVTHLEHSLWSAEVDRSMVEQTLVNLAVNARDAITDTGSVTFETTNLRISHQEHSSTDLPEGRYVRIAVRDTGRGMAPEVQERVFEPFFTTKDVSSDAAARGLGLSTAYGFVREAGGHMSVSSTPNQGTTFEILLPALDDSSTTAVALEAPTDRQVLLVEDDPGILRLASRLLRREGYVVRAAASGEDALTLLERTRFSPDLLVTDLVMPGMNGTELAEQVVVRHPGVAVVYMSGYSEERCARDGMLQPPGLFVQKPFGPDGLLGRVGDALAPPRN